jgi:hypothetical protein
VFRVRCPRLFGPVLEEAQFASSIFCGFCHFVIFVVNLLNPFLLCFTNE